MSKEKTSWWGGTGRNKPAPVPRHWQPRWSAARRMSFTSLVQAHSFSCARPTKSPIVALTADPVAQGLIANMARPGGNIIGASIDTGPAIHGKRLALLREGFPAMSKLACLVARDQWAGAAGGGLRAASEQSGMPLIKRTGRISDRRNRLSRRDCGSFSPRHECDHGGG